MNMENYTQHRVALLFNVGLDICGNCGSIENLEFHHVNNNGNTCIRGGNQQLIQLEKDYSNYLNGDKTKELKVLCKDCHIELHKEDV